MFSFLEIVYHVQMKKYVYTIHSLTKNELYTYMFGGN